MNQMRRAIGAYNSNAVLTTPPLVAVVMLYDGIMTRIRRAAEAARARDYGTQFTEVLRAAKIVDGLNRCLDMQQGGQVALSLRALYQSVSATLLRSTGKKNGAESLDRLYEAVRKTRDAWAQIAGIPLSGDVSRTKT
jgi:flagellar protein FliS